MMLKLLYGYCTGVRSSRQLEAACVEQVAFRFLAANQCPDHRAFSRLRRRHLAAIVAEILEEAEQVDAEEDERYGGARGDELPEHLRTSQGRLEAIRKAKAELEDEAAEQAAQAKERTKAERAGEDPDEPEVVERCEQAAVEAAEQARPADKAQRNFTDPQSRIMRTSDRSFHQCCNAQRWSMRPVR